MRRWLVSAGFLLPFTVSASALADDKCPPGSWFCESVELDTGDTDAGDDDLATDPDESPSSGTPSSKKQRDVDVEDDSEDVTAPGERRVEIEGDEGTRVVIVKKRKGKKKRRRAQEVVVADDQVEARSLAKKKKQQKRWRERFGLNLRIEGAAFIPRDGDDVVGMGGAGVSFRWRPSPYFAFDIGGDIVGGHDYNGDERVEFIGSLSGMVYFNPQHRVQVYAIGGIHLSHAEVDTYGDDWNYNRDYYYGDDSVGRNYFGGHGGLGLEFRISRHFAMFVDAMAIIRTRIDSDDPEFRDPSTGATSNTSGAGLFRTGVTFWW